ncbi:DUF309 domain-containing protein [Deinococcus lacus]|uniref:DUF309 domain-containing protein n=1 Tax=Deinococcus lacus TaxID=392561 RepID=A0ABW1YEA3_9DEIO
MNEPLGPEATQVLRRGQALFEAGHWWEAHEAWEAAWLPATGTQKSFFQALILLAAALHKRWRHGSLAHRNFYKAERVLATLPDEYAGVDLRRLRQDVWQALSTPGKRPVLWAPGENSGGRFDNLPLSSRESRRLSGR